MWSVLKKKATYQLSGENGGLTQSLHPVEGADAKSKPQIGTADGRKVYTQEEADNG